MRFRGLAQWRLLAILVASVACHSSDSEQPDSDGINGSGDTALDLDSDVTSDSGRLGDSGWNQDSGLNDTGSPLEPALLQVEVLIVGAGPAGLAAAATLETAGIDYWMVELDEQIGGSARYAGSLMTFSGSSTQVDAGIEDSPETLLSEWEQMTGGNVEEPWVQTYAQRNVAVHDWLRDRGVLFTLGSLAMDGAETRRVHLVNGEGATLINTLATGVDQSRIWTQTRATELVTDSNGEVRGVWVEQTAATGWIQAEATLVATGGFLRNLDLVKWARPELNTEALWFSTGVHAKGSGHQMIENVGGAWANPSAVGLYAHGIADTRKPGEELILQSDLALVMVNSQGERFTSEAPTASFEQGSSLVAQDGQAGWYIFDSSARSQLRLHDPLDFGTEEEMPTLDDLESTGQMVRADTLEDLAGELGIDAEGLLLTIDQLNQIMDKGAVDPWWEMPPQMRRVSSPPFFGIPVVPVLAKSFGGIAVDETGRVLNATGEWIPGLYGAGELTGMAGGSLVGDGFFTGSLSAVILSGWIAAEGMIESKP